MKKKRVLLTLLIAAALGFLCFWLWPSSEPSYNGHSLSHWVIGLIRYDSTDHGLCQPAVEHIGAPALPFLVKWIKYEQPAWRRNLGIRVLQSRLPSRYLRYQLGSWIIEPSSMQRALGTYEAFSILGERANPAFEQLCRILDETNAPQTASRTALTLGCFGAKAIPPLVLVATNPQHPARACALQALGRISLSDDAGRQEISVLTNCVSATNPPVLRRFALMALANFKTAPEISIPGLASYLADRNPTVRSDAVEALGKFGPEASNTIPALTNALRDSNRDVRKKAAMALHQIAPATFTNAPTK